MPEEKQQQFSDAESRAYRELLASDLYLPMNELEENNSYLIIARNASVGIWLPSERGFLISRYKFGPDPYLFVEYHWDTGEPFGTVKPLRLLELCQLQASKRPSDPGDLLNYLDELSMRHPLVCAEELKNKRKESATIFRARLRKERPTSYIPIHIMEREKSE